MDKLKVHPPKTVKHHERILLQSLRWRLTSAPYMDRFWQMLFTTVIKISDAGTRFAGLSPSRVWRLYLLQTPKEPSEKDREVIRRYLCDIDEQLLFGSPHARKDGNELLFILKKKGVTDPIEQFAKEFFRNNGLECLGFQEGTLLEFERGNGRTPADCAGFYNPLIEGVYTDLEGYLRQHPPKGLGGCVVRVRSADAASLLDISKQYQLSLNLREMQAIKEHFDELGRDPTDCELETVAQTWSEHCKHKTITAPIQYKGELINGLLQQTIKKVTTELNKDFCLSVFRDNAGIVRFTDAYAVCAKVETHNHPSAIEPFGGANTGLGGVIRDILGCGLVSRPIASVDVFAVGFPRRKYPDASIQPSHLLKELVRGVGDYGNKIGIPTVAGAVLFHDDYRHNPLVYCGTIGLIPADRVGKGVREGDLIVLVGGRTGRDGLRGATFSSVEVTASSGEEFMSSVQIGNPIEEKKVMDALLEAAEQGLIDSVTDCGAGGLSSAIGEMGQDWGAEVRLEKVPLKYDGLSPKEIWLSESQERMVLAIQPDKYERFSAIMDDYDVECTVIGSFVKSGKLVVRYGEEVVCELGMEFMHNGLPREVLNASWSRKSPQTMPLQKDSSDYSPLVEAVMGHDDVASKEWIVRQYDHEVFGKTIAKPFAGRHADAPSDGAVILLPDGKTGVAIGLGVSHRFSNIDPYKAAACSIDEAVRNVVALGADPEHIALLDNFCWPSVSDPEDLGALVESCKACYDVALAYGTPFISGKDSLNNEFSLPDGSKVKIPYTLLITAIGRVGNISDVRSSPFAAPKRSIYLLGMTDNSMIGSVCEAVTGRREGILPEVRAQQFIAAYKKLHSAIKSGIVESVHDISDGGLAVSVLESCFGGDCGAYIDLVSVPAAGPLRDCDLLFAETPGRFIIGVVPENELKLEDLFAGIPISKIGYTKEERTVVFKGLNSYTEVVLDSMKAVWKNKLVLDDTRLVS